MPPRNELFALLPVVGGAIATTGGIVIVNPKRMGPSVAIGLLSFLAVASVAFLLGWLAVEFAVTLTGTFEVVASIIGWILWPLWI